MVWPAIYIAGSVYKFWFLVFVTIITEAFVLLYYLKVTLKQALLISTSGNLISGIAGTVLMVATSLLFHVIVDTLFFKSSFNTFNWIASYLIMCFGSVFIEIVAVKLIWDYEFKKLILPLTIGNVLSYILIIAFNNFNVFYKGVN